MKHLLTSAFLFLAACGGSSAATSSDTTPTQPTAGIANPASVYCTEIGGELEMREGEGGTAGVCKKDGAECDEWALYRGECPEMGPGHPGEATSDDGADATDATDATPAGE